MVGVISTRHLFTHPRTIVHAFGMGCYIRCVWRTVAEHGRPVTFLECVDSSRVRVGDEDIAKGRPKLALEPDA